MGKIRELDLGDWLVLICVVIIVLAIIFPNVPMFHIGLKIITGIF